MPPWCTTPAPCSPPLVQLLQNPLSQFSCSSRGPSLGASAMPLGTGPLGSPPCDSDWQKTEFSQPNTPRSCSEQQLHAGRSYARGEHRSKGCAGPGGAAAGTGLKVTKLHSKMQPSRKQAMTLYWLPNSTVGNRSLQTGCCSAQLTKPARPSVMMRVKPPSSAQLCIFSL